ncbi:hypothetical protein GEMRC1_013456 [Eukaryota sp. GEM-RC1]
MTDRWFVATPDVVNALEAHTPCSLLELVGKVKNNRSLRAFLLKNCPTHMCKFNPCVTLVDSAIKYSLDGVEPVFVDLPLPIVEDSVPQDPLSSFPFATDASFYDLLDSSITKHLFPTILSAYHSNVLPFIGSTGIGKTRTLIEMSKNTKHEDRSYKYAAFPRLDGNTTLNSWPASTKRMITWMTSLLEPFSRSQTVLKVVSVILCEVLIVSIYDCHLSGDNWLEYHDSIVFKCINTWEKVKHLCIGSTGGLVSGFSIKKVTKFLCELKNDESEAILPPKNLVLLLDEVGSLISFSEVCFEQGWNLYRSLRHASRNIHSFNTGLGLSLLVVVAGTDPELTSFCPPPVRKLHFRPELILYESNLIGVSTGNTISPIFVFPKQLNPGDLVSNDAQQALMERCDMSLRFLLSLRPLWVSYYSMSPRGYQKLIYGKVDTALALVCKKLSEKQHGKTVAALLLMLGSVCTIPHSVLSLLVESSFGNIVAVSEGNKELLLTRPCIDPLVFSACWKCISTELLDFPDYLQGKALDKRCSFLIVT